MFTFLELSGLASTNVWGWPVRPENVLVRYGMTRIDNSTYSEDIKIEREDNKEEQRVRVRECEEESSREGEGEWRVGRR